MHCGLLEEADMDSTGQSFFFFFFGVKSGCFVEKMSFCRVSCRRSVGLV